MRKIICFCIMVVGIGGICLTGCKEKKVNESLRKTDANTIVKEDGIYIHDEENRVEVTSKGIIIEGDDGRVSIDYSDFADDLGDFLDDVIPDRIIVNVNE